MTGHVWYVKHKHAAARRVRPFTYAPPSSVFSADSETEKDTVWPQRQRWGLSMSVDFYYLSYFAVIKRFSQNYQTQYTPRLTYLARFQTSRLSGSRFWRKRRTTEEKKEKKTAADINSMWSASNECYIHVRPDLYRLQLLQFKSAKITHYPCTFSRSSFPRSRLMALTKIC